MKIIGRYVLKEHVGPFVFASTALTSLMLLQYIAKKFGELVGRGLPARVIAEFMALSIPFTVAMTMPMAVLVAVLYAFSRLAAENEITAMKASGVGMRDVMIPVMGFGLVMSLVMLAFNDQVLPRANHRLAILQLDIFRTKPTFALKEQVLNTVKEGQLYLRAEKLEKGSSLMRGVTIYDLSDMQRRRTIYADSGTLTLAKNRSDLDMTLFHGEMQETPNSKPGELTRLFYVRDRLRVKNVFSSFQESQPGSISKGDREMSICEMNRQLARGDYQVRQAGYEITIAKWERAGGKGKRPEPPKMRDAPGISSVYCKLFRMMAPRSAEAQAPPRSAQPQAPAPSPVRPPFLNRPPRTPAQRPYVPPAAAAGASQRAAEELGYQARVQEGELRYAEALRERNRYDVEIQKKFSLAAACIIFVLIGAPIALRFPRGGVGLVIGVSFAVFGLYYVGLIGGETLADKGYLPPWVAMWAANIVLLMTGLVLASQMGREPSSARGGDFAELWATARARLFGWMRQFGIPVERRRA